MMIPCRCIFSLLSINSNIKFMIRLCCVNFVLVTSLPRDRLSQVTRRGMLTYTKSHAKLHTAGQSEERHVGHHRKTGPSIGAAVGRGIPREQARVEEREEVNLLDPTSELNRLLESEESNIVRITFITYY